MPVPSCIAIGKVCSQACFLDAEGWRGVCAIHERGFVFRVWHYGRELVHLAETVRRGHPWFTRCVREWWCYVPEFVKKRRMPAGDGEAPSERVVDETLLETYPALHEYLTLDWMEGAPRQTATLGISVDQGRWKGRLADRDSGLVCFVAADTFHGVLEALDRVLRDDSADWRTDRYAAPKQPKRSRG